MLSPVDANAHNGPELAQAQALAPAQRLYAQLSGGHARFAVLASLVVVWVMNTTLGRYLVSQRVVSGALMDLEGPLEWLGTVIFVIVTICLIIVIYRPYPTWLFRVAAAYLVFSVLQVVVNVIAMVSSATNRHGSGLGSLWDVAAVYGMSVIVFALIYVVLDIRTPGGAFVWPARPDEEPPTPNIFDYLFISLNVNSTYGPTSEVVMSRLTKAVMAGQVILAILMLTVLIASAVSATS